MNATLSSNARWGNGYEARAEAMANENYRPVTGERVVTYTPPAREPAEQRKARLAQETGTRQSLWK